MLLQHLEGLAKTAYSGISSNPEEISGKLVEEYSKELDADVQLIKKTASSFSQDATAVVNRYQNEYEMYLTVWLNTLSKSAKSAVTTDATSEESPMDTQTRSRRIDNKFKRFREWRDKVIKGIERKFLPRNTPLTELESARKNLEEREKKQRLMKKANSILRSKKDIATRLLELLGQGSEAEITRLQQSGEEGKEVPGYSAHELNNNNANIFRLKRRVEELEKKIHLMEHSSQEMEEVEGIKMIFNYAADRIQLFFVKKPEEAKLRQLKLNGWHWSPSSGCWQRKITASARKSAEQIYKGQIVEEKKVILPAKPVVEKVVTITPKVEKVRVPKAEKPKKEKSDESNTLKKQSSMPEKIAEPAAKKQKAPVAATLTAIRKEDVLAVKEEKSSGKPPKHVVVKKEKIAAKRELKREIMIKPNRIEAPLEIKTKVQEKPKAIDWAKIAASVQQRNAPKDAPKMEEVAISLPETEEKSISKDYSYEAYSD